MIKEFLERFPKIGEKVENNNDRALIGLVLKEAELELNRDVWGELYQIGLFTLAADKLVQTPLGEDYQNPANPTEKTVFAVEFERLCSRVAMGARVV